MSSKNKKQERKPQEDAVKETKKTKRELHAEEAAQDGLTENGQPAAAETAAAGDEIEVLREELADLTDKHMRVVAEYENFRRRTRKEKESLYEDSIVDVIKAWLPVLDNLDRAITAGEQASSEESKQMAEGMKLVRKQALETMQQLGVTEMDCLGEHFDPEYHDAVVHTEDEQYGENEIIEILQKGYQRGERVIRYCMVRVAN